MHVAKMIFFALRNVYFSLFFRSFEAFEELVT